MNINVKETVMHSFVCEESYCQAILESFHAITTGLTHDINENKVFIDVMGKTCGILYDLFLSLPTLSH